MTLQTAENGKKSKVRPVYTVDQVRDMVAALYEQKPSYRRIAKEDFGGKVTFGDVQRIIHGIEPKSPQKRAVFGLPEYQMAPVCLKCGQVHVTKKCTAARSQSIEDDPEAGSTRRRPIQYEHRMQVRLMKLIKFHQEEYPDLEWVFAVPNGGKRNLFVARKMKAEGQKKGVPDVWLPVKKHTYSGLVIELKYGDNQPTREQKRWIAMLEMNDFLALVVNDIDKAMEIFIAYVSQSGRSMSGKSLWELIGPLSNTTGASHSQPSPNCAQFMDGDL